MKKLTIVGALLSSVLFANIALANNVQFIAQFEGVGVDNVALVEGDTYTFNYVPAVHDPLVDAVTMPNVALGNRIKTFLAGISGLQVVIPLDFTNVDAILTANFQGFNLSPLVGGNTFNPINGMTPWVNVDFTTTGTNPFNNQLGVIFPASANFVTIVQLTIPGYTIGSPLGFAAILGPTFDLSSVSIYNLSPFTVGISHFTGFVGGTVGDFPLSVSLSEFNATSSNSGISLTWKTESETDNLGFALYRNEGNIFDLTSATKVADYTRNSELRGKGTTTLESFYSFTDKNVNLNQTYTYVLSDFDAVTGEKLHKEFAKTITYTKATSSDLRFRLEQNYPNPFNPTTTIDYTVAEAGKVSVLVFNVLGQEIRSFSTFHNKAGNGSFVWDGKDSSGKTVSSGIYFYKMTTENYSSIKKAVFLK
ncbi:T9SS type A sorting domain-containing protein [bacterium]|nr:T9SS type A sorting domain-containing protein [bacterium]